MTLNAMDAVWPLHGITLKRFLRDYWQRKPLVLRQGMPGFRPLRSRAELFALAGDQDTESRMVRRDGETWSLAHGPFTRRAFPALKQPAWTLLVQGMNLLDDNVNALLDRFRFIPDARLDDIMISWASDKGGVGPHVDDYDVFLIQAEGRRRWRLGPVPDRRMRADQPLKLLEFFEPDMDLVAEPGDVIYLPPAWGHDGIAEGPCMTYSVGFRAPPADELLRQLLWKLADELPAGPRYSDRGTMDDGVALHPARVPAAMVDFLRDAFARLKPGSRQFEAALAELLTEPKQQVWFEPASQGGVRLRQCVERSGLRLDRRSRMLYTAHVLTINGEQVPAALARSALLRRFADRRVLDAAAWGRASDAERALLLDWCTQGWVVPGA